MILVDANVFMYAAGTPHPHKAASVAALRRIAAGELEAVTDAEVLQEILHRYRMLRRWEDGKRVYDLARRIVPQVLPVSLEVMDEARRLLNRLPRLQARDAVHAAVARVHGAEAILSHDADFDQIPGLRRRDPGHTA